MERKEWRRPSDDGYNARMGKIKVSEPPMRQPNKGNEGNAESVFLTHKHLEPEGTPCPYRCQYGTLRTETSSKRRVTKTTHRDPFRVPLGSPKRDQRIKPALIL